DPEGLMELIERLNEDEEVDGILVQSPLPPGFDEVMVTEAIDPGKDVDGFHPVNLGRIVTGKLDGLLPCTPSAVIRMLESTGEPLSGKRALVVGRSRIVGMPAALLLAQRGVDATVTISHSKSQDLRRLCLESDIIVAAVGRPGMIEADWVAPGAIVIDVGINRISVDGAGKLVGDVEEGAFERASWMTPVPGGVGPMTIAMLMSNTIKAASMRS
ncbi:MAG: bifunctional 5,10-methylenetetrahydrofolate dehydrogenase/5,10-methenyltetrahydrofolate cyclohydrolase, partial [Euryarchaeota archaeon]|nr:bifunctional 5,10-methylenetetrahydrofolate dehydrogenase/5,10-methenyltetrahydrofolate cyclohydrolase [Euryarchaeota archaeon]NDB94366.1 bifunctional 5,10-methylenetetrahydrofolate dehydrogenase/5,10-methenyltetrahydrofolate cyclohydrolase [Euryarchaeota archaeon]